VQRATCNIYVTPENKKNKMKKIFFTKKVQHYVTLSLKPL
jgi:hypothetical protein